MIHIIIDIFIKNINNILFFLICSSKFKYIYNLFQFTYFHFIQNIFCNNDKNPPFALNIFDFKNTLRNKTDNESCYKISLSVHNYLKILIIILSYTPETVLLSAEVVL